MFSKSYSNKEYWEMLYRSWMNDADSHDKRGWLILGEVCREEARKFLLNPQ